MFSVRKLVPAWYVSLNICSKAKHIPGFQNELAGSLSRLQLRTIRQLVPTWMLPFHNVGTSSYAPAQRAPLALYLLRSSLQPSSVPTYQRKWKLFTQFFSFSFQSHFTVVAISPPVLFLFTAFIFQFRYTPSIVSIYVSALGYFNNLKSFSDPSKVFCVCVFQMLKGFTLVDFRLDSGLPITLPILV